MLVIDVKKELIKKLPELSDESTFLKKSIIKAIRLLSHEDSINKFLNSKSHLTGLDFIDAVLDNFNFDFICSGNDLKNIPATGRVVIIANHHLGSLDALSLLKMVGKVRKDVKIIANDFLMQFEALESILAPVDTFKNRQTKGSIKNIYEILNEEMALIVFPAGEVSRLTPKGIKDKKWHKGFLDFAQKTNSPILPVYIAGKNSKTFYTVSSISKPFSTLLLSREMFNKQNKKIKITVGEMIPAISIKPSGFTNKQIVTLYKKHLYGLKKKNKKSFFVTQKAIAHPEDKQKLKSELSKASILGKTGDGKIIYFFEYAKDSSVIKEIGRLREISFRHVGEGTNTNRDIDNYDKYYKHIVLWDKDDLEIVGSYRIGQSDEIMEKFGKSGFYSSSLFKFEQGFEPYLKDSLELGRSFVQPKYWGTRALDYLWYGIGAYLKANPNIKYMFGPVSLSASYPQNAKDAIIYYYSKYYSDENKLLTPKVPYRYRTNVDEIKEIFIFEDRKDDFKALKTYLQILGVSVPTLYKQYCELCKDGGSKFLGFNIDKDFANCVDGLILVDVSKVKDAQRNRYINNNLRVKKRV